MAILFNFGIWNVTTLAAKQSWTVSPAGDEAIALVHADFYRDGQMIQSTRSTRLVNEASIGVENFTGEVKLVLRVHDYAGNLIGQGESSVMVYNKDIVPPTMPGFLHYHDLTPTSVRLEWEVSTDDRGLAGYRIYNHHNDITDLLATVPPGETSYVLNVDTRTLGRLFVRAVDLYDNESSDSPWVVINVDRGDPKIRFSQWKNNRIAAWVEWEISDDAFLVDVRYDIWTERERVENHLGNPIGMAEINVSEYQGPVTLRLSATNALGETATAETTFMVYNKAPLPPRLTYTGLTHKSVVIHLEPNPKNDADVTGYVLLYSRGVYDLQDKLTRPVDVLPGTRETFYARAYTIDGAMSALSEPLSVNIPVDPAAPPVRPAVYVGSPLAQLEALMTPEIRRFLMQMYTDSRRRSPDDGQLFEIPEGFQSMYDYYSLMGDNFSGVIRRERTDEESYLASELIDKTKDPLHRLAIWVERLEHSYIFNLGG